MGVGRFVQLAHGRTCATPTSASRQRSVVADFPPHPLARKCQSRWGSGVWGGVRGKGRGKGGWEDGDEGGWQRPRVTGDGGGELKDRRREVDGEETKTGRQGRRRLKVTESEKSSAPPLTPSRPPTPWLSSPAASPHPLTLAHHDLIIHASSRLEQADKKRKKKRK